MNEELALEGVDTPDPEQVAAGTETEADLTDAEEAIVAEDSDTEMEFISELDHAVSDETGTEVVASESTDETEASDESDITA